MLLSNSVHHYLRSLYSALTSGLLRWTSLPHFPLKPSITENKISRATCEVTKAQYEPLLRNFLRDANIDIRDVPEGDQSLEDALYAEIEPTTPDKRLARACANTAMFAATCFFPSHDHHVQYLIGVFSAYFVVVEDSGHSMVDDLAQFRRRLISREKQPALLERMGWLLEEFDKSYSSFSANKLFNGIINAWSVFEVEYDKTPGFELTNVNKEGASPLFPHYFRNMTGCSEVYVFFLVMKRDCTMPRMRLLLQVTPELINITDEINDLFSFYKESVIDIERPQGAEVEHDNFIYQEAGVRHLPVLDILRSVGSRIRERQELIDTITKDDPKLQDLIRAYVKGQFQFYFAATRYRLSELDLAY